MTALVVPRPIGWISTVSRSGVVNLAPYSFFNVVSGAPPFVMFASKPRKDSQRNAEETGEFVCNMATYDLREAVNASSTEWGPAISEPERIGLEMAPCREVKPPRVARSPVALECKYFKTVELVSSDGTRNASSVVIGEVVGIHIDDSVIVNGHVDVTRMQPLARLGYMDYCAVNELFAIQRPAVPDPEASAEDARAGQGRLASTEAPMKLHWSPRSPFVRKVMIVAHEVGVADRIQCVRTVAAMMKPHPELMIDNPLSKIPTLVLDDGTVLYDSAGDLRVLRRSARRPEAVPGAVPRAHDGAAPPGAGRRAARRPGAVARGADAAGGAAVAALSRRALRRATRPRSPRSSAKRRRSNRAPFRSVMSPSDARLLISTSALPTGSGAGTTRSSRAGTRHLRPAHRSAPPSRSTTPKPRADDGRAVDHGLELSERHVPRQIFHVRNPAPRSIRSTGT